MNLIGNLLLATLSTSATSDITVKGFTPITEPIVISTDNARLTGEGADAVIAGGEYLTGWKTLPDGTWERDAPRQADGRLIWFEQLWVNGRRAARSPWPKGHEMIFTKARQEKTPTGSTYAWRNFVVFDEDVTPLSNVDWPHAQMVVRIKWAQERLNGIRFDAATGELVTESDGAWASWKNWSSTVQRASAFLENVPCGFTDPGDWFYDARAGKLRYRPRPGETPATAKVFAPTANLKTLVTIRNARNVVLENVALIGTAAQDEGRAGDGRTQSYAHQAAVQAPGAVELDHATGCAIRNCRIAQTGGYAVKVGDGSKSNRIERSTFTDLGAGGVMAGASKANPAYMISAPGVSNDDDRLPCAVVHDTSPDAVSFLEVLNCRINGYGRMNAEGIGVLFTHVSDSKILHCDIGDGFYSGVSVGWIWGYLGSVSQRNEIGFNRIYDLGKRTMSDLAGVYTLGTSHGTRVHDNVIFNVKAEFYGGWGLYTDEGSEGIVLENNLVYDTFDGGFHQHYGRNNIVRNNIFAFSERDQIAVTRAENHLSVAFLNNIIYWANADEETGHAFVKYEGLASHTSQVIFLGNLWWNELQPARTRRWTQFPTWQREGNDINGASADPLFVDVAKRDFRLKPNSPAFACGFKPFDFSRAGLEP